MVRAPLMGCLYTKIYSAAPPYLVSLRRRFFRALFFNFLEKEYMELPPPFRLGGRLLPKIRCL